MPAAVKREIERRARTLLLNAENWEKNFKGDL
jgi:hypothetical protein